MGEAVPALTLWLARHGQSTANAGAPAVADAPLTEGAEVAFFPPVTGG